jgi:hypothetical protein
MIVTMDVPELGGIAEISEEFGVSRSTVSMWHHRRSSSGFPDPWYVFRAGPVFDLVKVREWYAARAKVEA